MVRRGSGFTCNLPVIGMHHLVGSKEICWGYLGITEKKMETTTLL